MGQRSVTVVKELEPAGPSAVRVLDCTDLPVLEVDEPTVRGHFMEHGAVWLRGGRCNADDFLALVTRWCPSLMTLNSYERVRHPFVKEIQSVTGGFSSISLHSEMGHMPGRPHLLSLWCQSPARAGGDTLVVDGMLLWRRLSAPARGALEHARICYHMRLPYEWWTDSLGGKTRAVIARAARGVPDFRWELQDDGELHTWWTTSPVAPPLFSAEPAFCSNLFPYAVPGLTVTFADGAPVPAALKEELGETALALATRIHWQAGDVLLLDNSRWLHGRTMVKGTGRRVHILMGQVSFAPALLPPALALRRPPPRARRRKGGTA